VKSLKRDLEGLSARMTDLKGIHFSQINFGFT